MLSAATVEFCILYFLLFCVSRLHFCITRPFSFLGLQVLIFFFFLLWFLLLFWGGWRLIERTKIALLTVEEDCANSKTRLFQICLATAALLTYRKIMNNLLHLVKFTWLLFVLNGCWTFHCAWYYVGVVRIELGGLFQSIELGVMQK